MGIRGRYPLHIPLSPCCFRGWVLPLFPSDPAVALLGVGGRVLIIVGQWDLLLLAVLRKWEGGCWRGERCSVVLVLKKGVFSQPMHTKHFKMAAGPQFNSRCFFNARCSHSVYRNNYRNSILVAKWVHLVFISPIFLAVQLLVYQWAVRFSFSIFLLLTNHRHTTLESVWQHACSGKPCSRDVLNPGLLVLQFSTN